MATDEKKRRKISIDFDNDTEILLDSHKRGLNGASYSTMINDLVRSMYGLRPQVKKALSDAVESLFEKTIQERPDFGSMYEGERNAVLLQCDNIYQFLNDGISLNNADTPNIHMIKVDLQNAYALLPSDWIRIEWDNEKNSNFVGVIETKNSAKFGGIPHFYFTSKKEIYHLSETEENAILERCITEYPLFREILAKRVPLIKENGKIKNFKEYDAAPLPGFFSIPEDGTQSTFPFGAKIVRQYDE